MKKYYNFNTMFISLCNKLREFLKENNIYYELSGARAAYHFEILADASELKRVNDYLDEITIYCVPIGE